jgi:hypothetical protein
MDGIVEIKTPELEELKETFADSTTWCDTSAGHPG